MPRWLDRPLAITGIATLWWTLVAVISAANARGHRAALDQWTVLGASLVGVAGWIPLTVGVYLLVRRFPLRGAGWARALVVHMAGATAVIVLRALYIYALDPWIGFYERPPRLSLVLMHSVENNLFVYWLFVGVAHAAVYAREAAQRARTTAALEVAITRAELAALTAAMQPHFLFNTLGAIAELVHRDPDAADRGIVRLSSLLRRLIDDRRQLVPLRDELSFVRDYVEIERLRFGARLAVQWRVPDELLEALVPRLAVQPLIENALRHGLWPSGRAGTLTVAAARHGDALIIEVVDDGVGLPAGTPASERPEPLATEAPRAPRGLGLVRARLEHVYPGRGRLEVGPGAAGGVRAAIEVPCS